MKTFNVLFASGKMNVIKADEYDFTAFNGFRECRFRIKGVGTICRANLDRIECIEEVIENE